MKKIKIILLISFLTLIITSCEKEAKETVKSDNPAFHIELLFEIDGCKMYRFKDDGRFRYFSNCKGSVTWAEECGKNCTTEMNIDTK